VLFFTRSLVQWPFVPLLALALAPVALGLFGPIPRVAHTGRQALGLGLALFSLWALSATRGRIDPEAGRARAQWHSLSSDERGAGTWRIDALRSPRGLFETCGRRGDVELELQGELTLPESGRYLLALGCGGSCQLWLGETEVARGQGQVTGEATLQAGRVPLRLRLAQPGERAFVTLDWDRPAFIEASRLSDALAPAGSADLRSRERTVLGRASLQAAGAAAAALLMLGLLAWMRASAPSLRAWAGERGHRKAAALGLVAGVGLAALYVWSAPHALPSGSLQAWTSEYMMQTLSVADLRDEPLRSLFYLHIQPPLFDTLRAALVALQPAGLDGPALMRAVDRGLYVCWGLAYALAVALVYVFLGRLGPPRLALAGAALFALHPAVLFYATFLDSTFLSALLVLWLGYELWRCGPGAGSEVRLVLSVLVLFFTRSLVQWPFVPLLALALWLRGCELRRALRVLLPVALVMGVFLAKQYALFGLTITSSFGPDSFCKGLSAYCQGTTPVALPHALPGPGAAGALRRTAKLNGEYNYNQLAFLERSFSQMQEYRALLRNLPPAKLGRLMAHNLGIWLGPSSRHSAHVLVDRLPWRVAFDALTSGAVLILLLLGATLVWLRSAWPSRRALRAGLGLALPVLYFAATSIVFESGENMRYKFFVEPLLWVFVWSQGYVLWVRLNARRVAA